MAEDEKMKKINYVLKYVQSVTVERTVEQKENAHIYEKCLARPKKEMSIIFKKHFIENLNFKIIPEFMS